MGHRVCWLSAHPRTHHIYLQKIQIFDEQGEKDKAIAEMEKLVDFMPENTHYRALLADTRANSARLRTGGEWKRRTLDDGFGATLLRHVLMALYIATKDESSTPLEGKTYLRAEVSDYWNKRDRIQEILKFITAFSELANMRAWHREAEAARIIKELVANDGI